MPHSQPALHLRRAQQFAEVGLKIATDTAGMVGRSHSHWRKGSLTAVGMKARGSGFIASVDDPPAKSPMLIGSGLWRISILHKILWISSQSSENCSDISSASASRTLWRRIFMLECGKIRNDCGRSKNL